MGFNISVCGGVDSGCEGSDVFINRSYYNFVASYDLFEEESVLVKAGEYAGLDLHPLTNVAYLDGFEEGDEAEVEQDVDKLLTLVNAFIAKVKSEPSMIDKINYKAKAFQYSMWKDYFHSGGILEDLEALSQALTHYKNAGESKVFFGVG
ncbi:MULTISPECIES: hypothetical protein [Hymenobacter]|uniref:DUF1877 family protein n=1 Tax=Hymenobacter armeniacus TaxID=2771358 RepID=A0ABR8JKS8_9BACT|nr:MULTISPECIES: hypothetical protein [Hymenobacter]MBD2720600.1 hypothetical protein [Hymenobacter armeniacus]MBJ6111726.1 hypothetical protein [Hymenobacter sp. BT523]